MPYTGQRSDEYGETVACTVVLTSTLAKKKTHTTCALLERLQALLLTADNLSVSAAALFGVRAPPVLSAACAPEALWRRRAG
jgi:hypothetical protein